MSEYLVFYVKSASLRPIKCFLLLMAITYVHNYSLLFSLQIKFFVSSGCKNNENSLAMAL